MADDALAALAAHVGAFHVTDRGLNRAREALERALADGASDAGVRDRFLAEARRYFSAFAREAHAGLRDVDRRLVNANQVQFNLAAERAVAVKRIEAVEAIVREIAGVVGGGPA